MFPRKITSLQEDMQKLGLTKLVNPEINRAPREQPRTPAKRPVTESRELTPREKAKLQEQKKALTERKKRAKLQREARMTKKVAIFETRLQRITRKATESKKKLESKVRPIKDLKKRIAALEAYDLRKALGGKEPTAKQLGESFLKVASLAGTLARTFAVVESFLGEAEADMGIPVIHPGSAYGYASSTSFVGDGSHGAGDVTSYAGDAKQASEDDEEKPADDVQEDDDEMDDKVDDDMTTESEDDDKDATTEDDETKDDEVKTEDDGDGDEDDVQTEDDDEKKDDDVTTEDDEKDDEDEVQTEDDEQDAAEKKTERRRRARAESIAQKMPMDYELHAIRLEAEEMGVKVADGKAQNVNMGYATELLNDMVSYLGGAMKLYFKIQQSMAQHGYVGQDQPAGAGADPVATANPNDAYIGQGKPQGETAIGDGGAGTGTAPKSGTATDMTGQEAPKAESKK